MHIIQIGINKTDLMDYKLLIGVLFGMFFLFVLIIRLKIPAFLSLIIASIITALICGMDPSKVMETVKNGMGSTLGFVATIVGLGSIFGGILEKSGGAHSVARYLLDLTGDKNTPLALLISGFLVSIPVFFDVGIIILFPMISALHKQSNKSILYYAVPLLAGLAVSHAFIPPTPGPMAVAELLGSNMFYTILVGCICGLPAAYFGGIVYGSYISKKLYVQLKVDQSTSSSIKSVNPILSLLLITFPIFLIVIGTLVDKCFKGEEVTIFLKLVTMLGHPFSALIIANIMAWVFLGLNSGFTKHDLLDISNKALIPAGIIILVTGAGGIFKQVLIDTGAGKMIAETLQSAGIGILFFGFLTSAIIRIVQGSATVAMITSAGLAAPVINQMTLTQIDLATLVVAIASGATMASHVNDSGFWLVKEYLQLNERQAFKTWTITSSIIGLSGFIMSTLVFYLF
jgi:Gnt-I system low-affinity gluconate transporter